MWELCLLNIQNGGRKQISVLAVPEMNLDAGTELLSTKLLLFFFFFNKRN